MTGHEVGADIDALQRSRGDDRQAVVLKLEHLERAADPGRRGDFKRDGAGEKALALLFRNGSEQGEIRLVVGDDHSRGGEAAAIR